jgi:MFS transporter, DHA2 family, multidrug resistance protein
MNPSPAIPAPRKRAFPVGIIIRTLRSDPKKLRILYVCTLAAMVTVFEPTYLNLSTSVVQTGLRTPNSQAPLMIAAAFLVLALVTVVAGASADLFGRRLFLLAGLGGLTLSNVLGLVLLHSPYFVFADILNTICGVLVMPAVIAIITLTFEPMVRPFAYGILFGVQGTTMCIAPLIIPVLGGIGNGRLTFIPAVALGILALVMAVRHIPESSAPKALRRGSVVVNLIQIGAMFVLFFLLITIQIRSQNLLLIILVVLVLWFFAAGVRWLVQRLRHFKGIEIYSRRDLGLAILAGILLMFAEACFFYQIAPFFGDVQHVGAVVYALRLAPFVIGLLIGGVLVARLAVQFGARRILVFSFILLGVAMLGLSLLKSDSSYWVALVPITLIGLGAGLGGPARTQVVLSSPPEGLVVGAAAVNLAAGQAGYSLGVIVSSVLVTQFANRFFLSGLTSAGVPADIVTRLSGILQDTSARLAAAAYPHLPEAVTTLTRSAYEQAFTSGMTQMYFLVGIMMFLAALVLFIGMRRGLRATLAIPLRKTQTTTTAGQVESAEIKSTNPEDK